MDIMECAKFAGMIAGVIMPLFNIPLIYKIWKRKSSSDLSLTWALGVWSTIIIMTPSAVLSADPVFRIFGIANAFLFTLVVIFVLKYR
jgi:uncharacterized protein with PQ loop repeat